MCLVPNCMLHILGHFERYVWSLHFFEWESVFCRVFFIRLWNSHLNVFEIFLYVWNFILNVFSDYFFYLVSKFFLPRVLFCRTLKSFLTKLNFSHRPSALDATIFAYLGPLFYIPWKNKDVRQELFMDNSDKFKNLKSYVDRIRKRYLDSKNYRVFFANIMW